MFFRASRLPLAALSLSLVLAACGGAPDASQLPDPTASPNSSTPTPTATTASSDGPVATPTTSLDACEAITPADIEGVLDLDAGTVEEGALRETPTSLSPGRTECSYAGDGWRLIVSLTPEDGENLFDAARRSYGDPEDLDVAGSDGAFWSENEKRLFVLEGTAAASVTIFGGTDRRAMATGLAAAFVANI